MPIEPIAPLLIVQEGLTTEYTESPARRSRNQIATKNTKRREKDTKTNRQVAKDAQTIQSCTFVGRFALPSLAFSAPWRFYFRACP
jgi:hypothetical protein